MLSKYSKPIGVPFVLTKNRVVMMNCTTRRKGKKVPTICRVCDKPLLEGDEVCLLTRKRYVHSKCFHLARQDIGDNPEDEADLETFFVTVE